MKEKKLEILQDHLKRIERLEKLIVHLETRLALIGLFGTGAAKSEELAKSIRPYLQPRIKVDRKDTWHSFNDQGDSCSK